MLELCHVDTCLPDYWTGSDLPSISIPVCLNMTLAQVKNLLHTELWEGAIDKEPETDKDNWYGQAGKAIDNLTSNKELLFTDIPEPDENSDSVYAYFVFVEKDA